ncbi:hypothetical protein D3C79_692840 [compost metagenome]
MDGRCQRVLRADGGLHQTGFGQGRFLRYYFLPFIDQRGHRGGADKNQKYRFSYPPSWLAHEARRDWQCGHVLRLLCADPSAYCHRNHAGLYQSDFPIGDHLRHGQRATDRQVAVLGAAGLCGHPDLVASRCTERGIYRHLDWPAVWIADGAGLFQRRQTGAYRGA